MLHKALISSDLNFRNLYGVKQGREHVECKEKKNLNGNHMKAVRTFRFHW